MPPTRLRATRALDWGNLGLQRMRSAGNLADLYRRLQVDCAAEGSALGGARASGGIISAPPFEALGWLILVWGAYRSPDAAVNSSFAIKGSFWCLHISDDGIERSVETYRAHSGFLTLFRTSLSLNGGMKGPVRWTDGTETLTMDSSSHRREGEPVLKVGPERVPSALGKMLARARPAAPRPRPRAAKLAEGAEGARGPRPIA
jgi:hypothetical protein